MVHDTLPSPSTAAPSRPALGAGWRPLSHARAGETVVVRRLDGPEDTNRRLREMGFGEEQRVRVISLQAHVLCQVCNARLGVSAKLAEVIMVESLGPAGGVGMRLAA